MRTIIGTVKLCRWHFENATMMFLKSFRVVDVLGEWIRFDNVTEAVTCLPTGRQTASGDVKDAIEGYESIALK
jgi:hypothetical protein